MSSDDGNWGEGRKGVERSFKREGREGGDWRRHNLVKRQKIQEKQESTCKTRENITA